jgi:hypothetical protein
MFSYSRSISSSISRSNSRFQFGPVLFLAFAAIALLGSAVQEAQAQTASDQPAQVEPAQALAFVGPAPFDPATQSSTSQTEPAAPSAQTTGHMTVQQRIKARREQRRLAAIREVYSHLYEAYIGGGFLRFTPGQTLQRMNEYNWNVGATRYFSERFGVTLDGRGNYGSAYVGINQYSDTAIFKPAISQYTAMGGPTYRFFIHPRYSISGRVMGGAIVGNFSGDLGAFKPSGFGLYSDTTAIAVSASAPIEYNVSPGLGLRFAPEYVLTTFGSSTQNNFGVTGGLVIRWGKQ